MPAPAPAAGLCCRVQGRKAGTEKGSVWSPWLPSLESFIVIRCLVPVVSRRGESGQFSWIEALLCGHLQSQQAGLSDQGDPFQPCAPKSIPMQGAPGNKEGPFENHFPRGNQSREQ